MVRTAMQTSPTQLGNERLSQRRKTRREKEGFSSERRSFIELRGSVGGVSALSEWFTGPMLNSFLLENEWTRCALSFILGTIPKNGKKKERFSFLMQKSAPGCRDKKAAHPIVVYPERIILVWKALDPPESQAHIPYVCGKVYN